MKALPKNLALLVVLAAPAAMCQPSEPFRIGALFITTRETYEHDLDDLAQLDSMSFNYWYVGLDRVPAPYRARFEAAAAARGIQMRTPTLVSIVESDDMASMNRLTSGWDFRLEAEDPRVSTVVAGRPVRDDAATPAGRPNAVASTGRGIVVRENESDLLWAPFYDPLQPAARVRFRLRWDGTAPPETPVARITASRLARAERTNPGNPVTRTVSAGELSACDRPCYVAIQLELDQSNVAVAGGNRSAGHFFRYSVEHLGPGTLFVDYVHADTEMARRVLAGAYDEAIVDFISERGYDREVYDGFSVMDEPFAFTMSAVGHLSDVVDRSLGRRANTILVGSQSSDYFDYYIETVRPTRLMTDPYFIGLLVNPENCSPDPARGVLASPDNPGGRQLRGLKPYRPAEYQADLQVQLGCLAGALDRASASAERAGIPYWYVAQAHGVFDATRGSWTTLRQVTPAEARLITFMGVAYGAKAVIYHLYKTVGTGGTFANVGMVSTGYRAGGTAVEPLSGHASDYDRDLVRGDSVYTGYRTVREAFRRVNLDLAAAGPTLMRLDRRVTYHSADGHPDESPVSTILDGAAPAPFVHVGVLEDRADGSEYLVLVNRMARPGDTRSLTVRLRRPHAVRSVVDVASGETVARLRRGDDSFAITMPPGDGRILALRR